jgi:aspartyl-tRNA(Asn)/glutamyl-tRNA(Gln) amidotransferase subunit C
MALTDSDVRHVARLARLGLHDDEVAPMRAELETILAHVSAIAELDLSGVPVTSHPLELVNVLADDVPEPCATHEDALLNAPDPAQGGFRVPPIGA